jgi:hypothetical protein
VFHSRTEPKPSAAAVYQRTQQGAEVAIGQPHNLTDEAYRLLLLVNGVTRLSDLAPFASRTALPVVVEDLLRASMIEPLEEAPA